jgi:hypothetical protein
LEVKGPSWSGAVCDSIVWLSLLSLLHAHPDMTLQHDNATSHTAHSVRDFLQHRNVSVLPWPAKSPDFNPIEQVWDLLDRRVRARAIPEMSGNLQVPWWKSGVTSHSKNWQIWCSPILNAAGGHTRYWVLLLILTHPLFRETLFHFC